MKRRDFLKSAGLLIPALVFPNIGRGNARVMGTNYSIRAIDLVMECPVVDLLNQFAWNQFSTPPVLQQWLAHPETFTEQDATTFRNSGIDVFALGHAKLSRQESLDYFTSWNKFIAANAQWLKRVDSVGDIQKVNRDGKTGIILTYQDSQHFESLDDINLFYSFGQRLSQLTYNYANKLGSGGFDNEDKGLTEYGRQVLKRMNELGMAIDLSHCSDRTTLEGIELSSKPVIITHANCRSLNPGHPRAKTDEMIRNLAAKGGVMGIATIRFMVRDQEPVTIEHFLDHYDYILKLVGAEHAAIGSDFDLETEDNPIYLAKRKSMYADMSSERAKKYRMHTDDQFRVGVEGIDHPLRTFDIVEGFIRRNYSDDTIRMILGGNFIRTATEIWATK